jgi:hypothetical protein
MASTAEKILETAKQLPNGLALEALHYPEYLRLRAEDHGQTLDLMQAQQGSMRRTWDNPDDVIWNDTPTR